MSQAHKNEVDKQNEIAKNIGTSNPNPKVTTEQDRELTSKDARDLLEADKAKAKERRKPKEYNIDTFKRPLNKDEKEVFNKLSKEEQRVFIIKRWLLENRTLDKIDMHEVSLNDEKEAGLVPA